MIETAIHAGIQRPMHLYWGARRREDIYMPDLPARWQQQLPWFGFTPVLSEPSSSWAGRTGLVHDAVREDHSDLRGADVYACGNPLMVTAARDAFTSAHHLPDGQFFADAFVASGPLSSDNIQPELVRS
jgi:NAD(P)H-flavin reductase